MTGAIVQKIFLAVFALKNFVEFFLERKNLNHIKQNRAQVPEKFKEEISLEEHQKAADYSEAKIKTGGYFQVLEVIVLLLWTIGGGLQALDMMVSGWGFGSILTGTLYFGMFGLISTILSLPQSIYSTFVIEEKFGFNKTDAKTFITDLFKGLIIGSLIGLPITAAILWIMEALGSFWWVYAWAFFVAIQFLLIWAYPTFIAPLFNKFEPLPEGEMKVKIESLLDRTGFESKGLFVMDASKRSSHGNAYFTGFGKAKRIVFFDNLIKTLTPEQVEAVLAHELGHFKRKHIVKGLVKSFLLSLIGFGILGALMNWQPFFEGHGVTNLESMTHNHVALLLFFMVSGTYTFFMTPISAYLSRKHEFEADAFAAEHSSARELIQALVKLYKDNASTLTPDPLYSNWYHSHPPANIRVQHLEKLAK